MATSFNTGFKLGSDMFTQAQRNRLAEEELGMARERDARAAEEFGWRRDAESRQRAKDAEVDSLTQQLTRPNADNYALAPSGGATGLGMRGSMPPAMGDTAGVAPTGLRMPAQGDAAPATGLRAPTMPDRPLTFNQAPTGAAAEDILGRIALTRGDTAGFRGSQAAARGFREDDLFKSRLKEYTGSPEQIDSTMMYVNQNSKSVTMGEPDKDGFAQLSVVRPDGKAIFARLPMQDQAKLYAAAGLMEMNPQRAFDMMAGVNKDLALAIAAENNLNVDLTKAGNDVASKRGTLANQREGLDIKRGQANATAGYYKTLANKANRPQAGDLREFQDDKGNAVMVDITGLKRDPDGRVQMPQGLKPRTAKPEFTPKAYAETVKLYTEAGFPVEDARMMADKDYGRGPAGAAGTSDQRLREKDKAVGQAQKPIVVRPGEVIAREPGTKIRGPIEGFLRESTRQPLWKGGGLSYGYRDPVTNQTYTIDEYNKLLSE